jgi:hypothetical protein
LFIEKRILDYIFQCPNFFFFIFLTLHRIWPAPIIIKIFPIPVQFYYLWKKTERHDVFANKARLEKKKYSLDPGLTTDYMDRFLEEQESNGSSQHHSASPSILGITRQRHDSGSSSGADGALYCQSQSMKATKASSTSNTLIIEKESVKNSTEESSKDISNIS